MLSILRWKFSLWIFVTKILGEKMIELSCRDSNWIGPEFLSKPISITHTLCRSSNCLVTGIPVTTGTLHSLCVSTRRACCTLLKATYYMWMFSNETSRCRFGKRSSSPLLSNSTLSQKFFALNQTTLYSLLCKMIACYQQMERKAKTTK